MKDNIYKLIRVGKRSLSVVLPIDIVHELGWREKQRLIVKRMPRGILIRDAITKHKKK